MMMMMMMMTSLMWDRYTDIPPKVPSEDRPKKLGCICNNPAPLHKHLLDYSTIPSPCYSQEFLMFSSEER